MMSLVIPVYRNSANIAPLLAALEDLDRQLHHELELVFVVDGSPDDSHMRLREGLAGGPLRAQLLLLSRNFGAFAAIRAGLSAGTGERFAVLAADLQEPPSLVEQFDQVLRDDEADVVLGQRVGREDPWLSRLLSNSFWAVYRRLVLPDVPQGGVDVFGCSQAVRDRLCALEERNSSLIGLLFWLGYRRKCVPYKRRAREYGVSAWTFRKKLAYLFDSAFSFSDLPIRALTAIGTLGLLTSVAFGAVVLVAKLTGSIPVPGYSAIVLTVTFFGALNCFGLGIIGSYVYRTFENTKSRPNYIVASQMGFPGIADREETTS